MVLIYRLFRLYQLRRQSDYDRLWGTLSQHIISILVGIGCLGRARIPPEYDQVDGIQSRLNILDFSMVKRGTAYASCGKGALSRNGP